MTVRVIDIEQSAITSSVYSRLGTRNLNSIIEFLFLSRRAAQINIKVMQLAFRAHYLCNG